MVLLNLREEGKERRREEREGKRREEREKEQKGTAEKVVPSIREGDLPCCQNILDALVPSGSNLHFACFVFKNFKVSPGFILN